MNYSGLGILFLIKNLFPKYILKDIYQTYLFIGTIEMIQTKIDINMFGVISLKLIKTINLIDAKYIIIVF